MGGELRTDRRRCSIKQRPDGLTRSSRAVMGKGSTDHPCASGPAPSLTWRASRPDSHIVKAIEEEITPPPVKTLAGEILGEAVSKQIRSDNPRSVVDLRARLIDFRI